AQETSRGISMAWAGMNAGAAVAPLIVFPIAAAYGWRSTFFVNGCVGIAWVLVCIFWFKNNPSEMKRISPDEKRLIESNRRYYDHRQKFPWRKTLRNWSLLAFFISFSTSQCANYFFLVWGKVYLTKARHFLDNEIKWTYAIAYSLATIGCFFGGHLSD